MLASDLNNPEFVGATNPDSLLHVEFYWHEPIDKWASEVQTQKMGKRVTVKMPKQIFVRIMRPGDKDTIIECAVREEHKVRWPDKWLYFQIAEGLIDGGRDIPGWKLEDWPELDNQQDMLRDLKYNRFYTVEQIAGAQDHQVQKLGIGGMGLRERARVALKEKMRKEFAADLEEKDKLIAKQGDAIEKLQKQMQELLAKPEVKAEVQVASALPEQTIPAAPKRRGRPPKQQVA